MMSGLFRLLLYIFFAYIIYLVIRLLFPPQRRRQRPSSQPRSSGVMVKDEVCNTYLPQEDALQEKVEGKEYFFCSEACRQKFLIQRKKRSRDVSD